MERAPFYEHVLGLRMTAHYQEQWMEYTVGDSTLAITTTEMGHRPGAKGAVVAFEVSDLDAFAHKMKDRAVTFVTEIFSTPVCRMAVIEDPDGNHITIHKRHV
jgi:predicted enzyme related to lactoylglutathione lyase